MWCRLLAPTPPDEAAPEPATKVCLHAQSASATAGAPTVPHADSHLVLESTTVNGVARGTGAVQRGESVTLGTDRRVVKSIGLIGESALSCAPRA